MLFFGSKKYPNHSIFDDALLNYDGFTNAYTKDSNTVFYFSCNSNGFLHLLNIFLNFFIEPLLNKENIFNEINAVQSEFDKLQKSNSFRYLRILQLLWNNKLNFNKFSVGSIDSLHIDNIQDELFNFFYKYYILDNISIVIHTNIDICLISNVLEDFHHNKIINEKKNKKIVKNNELLLYQNNYDVIMESIKNNNKIFICLVYNYNYNFDLQFKTYIDYIIFWINNPYFFNFFILNNLITSYNVYWNIYCNKSTIISIELNIHNKNIFEYKKIIDLFFSFFYKITYNKQNFIENININNIHFKYSFDYINIHNLNSISELLHYVNYNKIFYFPYLYSKSFNLTNFNFYHSKYNIIKIIYSTQIFDKFNNKKYFFDKYFNFKYLFFNHKLKKYNIAFDCFNIFNDYYFKSNFHVKNNKQEQIITKNIFSKLYFSKKIQFK